MKPRLKAVKSQMWDFYDLNETKRYSDDRSSQKAGKLISQAAAGRYQPKCCYRDWEPAAFRISAAVARVHV